MSELIYIQENIRYGKPWDRGLGPIEETGIMSFGRIWEATIRPWMALQFPGFLPQQILEKEEVIGTADGTYDQGIVEVKVRFAKYDGQPLDRWVTQTKAYCYMSGTRKGNIVVLKVGSAPPEARLHIHHFEWEDWELQENWEGLMQVRKYAESQGGSKG